MIMIGMVSFGSGALLLAFVKETYMFYIGESGILGEAGQGHCGSRVTGLTPGMLWSRSPSSVPGIRPAT